MIWYITAFLILMGPCFGSNTLKVENKTKQEAWSKSPLRYFLNKEKITVKQIDKYLGERSNHNLSNSTLNMPLKTPIVPFIPFGVVNDFDIVIAINDGPYSMIEVIKARYYEKDIWFILDSRFDGKQFVGLPKDSDQQEYVKSMAKQLGVKTYSANLIVKKEKKLKDIEYFMDYTRKDPEGIQKNKKMTYSVLFSDGLDFEKGNLSSSFFPKKNQRNSHTMNHSSTKLLGLIDIYKMVPITKIGKVKLKFPTKESKFETQKILGINILLPISQAIVGLSSDKKNLRDNNLVKISETKKEVVYEPSTNLKNLKYFFDKVGAKEELRKIEIRRDAEGYPLGVIHFNPSLPDLRYSLPSGLTKSKMLITVDGSGKNEQKVFFIGQAQIQNDSDGLSKMIEVVAGDFSKSPVYRMKNTPEWFYGRPLFSKISKNKNGLELSSHVMGANTSLVTEGFYNPSSKKEINVLKSWNLKWGIHPHRLSRLVIRHSDNIKKEMKQKESFHFKKNAPLAYMGGGTWANGEAGQDKTIGTLCTRKVTGASFYPVTTSSFPLFQSLSDFPFNLEHYKSHKGKVIGAHVLQIQLDEEIDLKKLAWFINGLKFDSGPQHRDVGMTISGLEFKIVNKKLTLPSGEILQGPYVDSNNKKILNLTVMVTNNFGPEMTRPSRGPTRQPLLDYTAYASLDLVIVHKDDLIKKTRNFDESEIMKGHFGFVNNFVGAKVPHCETETVNLNKTSHAFLSSFGFDLFNPKKGQRDTRYIRELSFNLIDGSNFDMTFDNYSIMSFKTKVLKKVEILELR